MRAALTVALAERHGWTDEPGAAVAPCQGPWATRAGPSRQSPGTGDWLLTLPGSKLAARSRQHKEDIIKLVVARAVLAERPAASWTVAP